MGRILRYSDSCTRYTKLLRQHGYTVLIHMVDDTYYDGVSVRGPRWRSYGGDFTSPRAAYNYLKTIGAL